MLTLLIPCTGHLSTGNVPNGLDKHQQMYQELSSEVSDSSVVSGLVDYYEYDVVPQCSFLPSNSMGIKKNSTSLHNSEPMLIELLSFDEKILTRTGK